MARKFWYIPWGHYRTTGQGVPPANEVWIGRHTERARLLDHLLHSDGRGAILITGARGSGKTSFVAHCLRDYQRAIHERFLIQKGGTLGIFDYAVVLFTAFVLILLEILGSGILSMFTGILERHIARDLWPPLLPLIPVLFISLLLLYPTYLGVLLVRRVRREVTAAKERNTAQTWPAGSIVLITRGLVMAALGVYSFWPMIGLILKFFGLDPCFLRESTDLLTDVGLLTAISLPPQSLYGALDIVVLLISWVLFCLFSFLEYGAMIRQTKGSRPEVDLPLRFYSLPWTVLRIWLPVLVVPVNLGFEALDLRRITRAMLVALREQFRQRFLSWTSPLANVLRLARLVAVVGAATLIGDRLFRPPGMEDAAEPQNLAGSEDPYWILKDLEEHPLRVTPEQDTLRLLPPVLARILYYNFTQPSELEQPSAVDSASSSELATSRTYKRLANFLLPTANYQGVEFRVYHLCLVLIILWSSEVLLRRAGLLPYRRVLEDIDRHLESLDARVKVEQREPSWTAKLSDLTISTLGGGRVSDRDVEDPRAVEQAMLSTLERLRRTRTLVVPATDGAGLWLPTPEVTFVFDELDKLRSPFTPEGGPSDGGGRSRSVAIHRLLAEMKNLLSAAPARFIFVGGRDLRDEWLADGTARNPLLTNIFTAEIYLPSLLHSVIPAVDHLPPGERWSHAVRVYLHVQHRRSLSLMAQYKAAAGRTLPWGGTPERSPRYPNLIDGQWSPAVRIAKVEGHTNSTNTPDEHILADLIAYLTYRSGGNTKHLKELLETLILPVETDNTVRTGPARQLPKLLEETEAHHVLAMSPDTRYRIELIAGFYRQIAATFEPTRDSGDDRLTDTLFHLSDFLLRFHGRAFSWGTLSRAEDLSDVHRAPDVRDTLTKLVNSWNGRYLPSVPQ